MGAGDPPDRFTAPSTNGIFDLSRAISSAGERCLHTAEVAGSKPASPTSRSGNFGDTSWPRGRGFLEASRSPLRWRSGTGSRRSRPWPTGPSSRTRRRIRSAAAPCRTPVRIPPACPVASGVVPDPDVLLPSSGAPTPLEGPAPAPICATLRPSARAGLASRLPSRPSAPPDAVVVHPRPRSRLTNRRSLVARSPLPSSARCSLPSSACSRRFSGEAAGRPGTSS